MPNLKLVLGVGIGAAVALTAVLLRPASFGLVPESAGISTSGSARSAAADDRWPVNVAPELIALRTEVRALGARIASLEREVARSYSALAASRERGTKGAAGDSGSEADRALEQAEDAERIVESLAVRESGSAAEDASRVEMDDLVREFGSRPAGGREAVALAERIERSLSDMPVGNAHPAGVECRGEICKVELVATDGEMVGEIEELNLLNAVAQALGGPVEVRQETSGPAVTYYLLPAQ